MKGFYPKRPVKSFLDLEVYQKALAICVAVTKRVNAVAPEDETATLITTELTHRVLKIPLQIAQAHSWRFADQSKAHQTLEEAMTNCNLAVVYLEQYRDICNTGIETDFFEEQVKGLVGLRQKTLYLQRSWRKFIGEKQ
ncbi:hypothetical protein HY949_05675 [Candidatus Gottesmanbacteria bacterium]|nr:hypothetical protein [Candidatus Gottesmanbacteria bacterium]